MQTMDQAVKLADKDELLEGDAVVEGMLAVHEYLGDSGLNPEDPQVYAAVIATIRMIAGHAVNGGDPVGAMEAVSRFALRGYRDIKARG